MKISHEFATKYSNLPSDFGSKNQFRPSSANVGERDLSEHGPKANVTRTESDENAPTGENEYQTAFKEEGRNTSAVPETNALNLNERQISNKEYFSFVNEQKARAEMSKADFDPSSLKNHY